MFVDDGAWSAPESLSPGLANLGSCTTGKNPNLLEYHIMFNPDDFLSSSITETNSTEVIPLPVGIYPAIITDVKARTWTSKDQTESGLALDILYDIQDQAILEELGRKKVTVKQGIMLDMNEQGGLSTAKGDNVQLGRVRQALNLNQPGVPFVPLMLKGQMCKVEVKHRMVGEAVYAEVKAVYPI